MRFCRTILALLIALSVAALPIAGVMTAGVMTASAAPVGELADTATQATTTQDLAAQDMVQPDVAVSAMDQDMHDCCPPSKAPCSMPMGQCLASACAHSIVFSTAPSLSIARPSIVAGAKLIALADSGFRAQSSSPPFRPPRI
jgi:hypothetical protein